MQRGKGSLPASHCVCHLSAASPALAVPLSRALERPWPGRSCPEVSRWLCPDPGAAAEAERDSGCRNLPGAAPAPAFGARAHLQRARCDWSGQSRSAAGMVWHPRHGESPGGSARAAPAASSSHPSPAQRGGPTDAIPCACRLWDELWLEGVPGETQGGQQRMDTEVGNWGLGPFVSLRGDFGCPLCAPSALLAPSTIYLPRRESTERKE